MQLNSVPEAVAALAGVARGTPLGRLRAWLLTQRAISRPFNSGNLSRDRSKGCNGGGSRLWQLLPSHLPPRPHGLFGAGEGSRSRRTAKRVECRRSAWLLAEWQLVVFNFYDMSCPKAPCEYSRYMGEYRISASQRLAFNLLVEENLRLCRLSPDLVSDASRGHQRYLDMLRAFESRWTDNSNPHASFSLDKFANVSLDVDPDRIAMPEQAATVRPEDFLTGARRQQFLDASSRVTADWDRVDLPAFCYRVSAEREPSLRQRLLSAGMASLIPAAEIPLTNLGRPLLSGLFCVAHKPHVDRLIFDRRPANWGEARLGWARLPLGPQLTRLVLGRTLAVRGSGDDLRSFFYYLRNARGARLRNAFGRAFDGAEVERFGGVPGTSYRLALEVVAMGD